MKKLLEKLEKLNLPKDKFAVYGSGPLGIRKIRKIKDLDVIVTLDLWKRLAKKYPTKDSGEKLKIDLGEIEILANPIIYSAEQLIREADIINGIRYVKLTILMRLKKAMGRKKDFKDIELIRGYLEKDKLIKDFIEIRKKIIDLVSSLPSGQLDEVFLGKWSAKDLLAHLIGWDYWNLKAAKEILAGKLLSFYSYYDPDWASFNAQLVKQYKKENFEELLSSLRESHQKLIGFLRIIPAEEFNKERGLRWKKCNITIVSEIQPEINDEKVHYKQIQDWKKRKR